MLKGIKGSKLMFRNGLFGMGCGGLIDLLYFDHVLASGFGLLFGLLSTYIYLALKYGRKNLNN